MGRGGHPDRCSFLPDALYEANGCRPISSKNHSEFSKCPVVDKRRWPQEAPPLPSSCRSGDHDSPCLSLWCEYCSWHRTHRGQEQVDRQWGQGRVLGRQSWRLTADLESAFHLY